MNRNIQRYALTFIIIAVLSAIALGLGYWYKNKNALTIPTASTAGASTAVGKLELLGADIGAVQTVALAQTLVASGSIKALRQAVVKSQVSATVLVVNVQEGQMVAAGTVLAVTDIQDYQSRVAAQQAAVAQAVAQQAIAQKAVDNNKALLEKNFISSNAYDTSIQQLDANKAAVVAAQANLAVSQKALQDTQIRSPIAGVVTEKLIAEGDKVSPDMKAFTITAPGAIEFEGSLPAAEASQLKVGQKVVVSVEGVSDIASTISRVNAAVSTGTRNVNFYASLQASQALRVGSFANAKVISRSSDTLAIPLNALREEQGRSAVYTLQGTPTTLQTTPVKVGLRGENASGEAYVAVEGLALGTSMVVRNLGPLRVGSTVTIVK